MTGMVQHTLNNVANSAFALGLIDQQQHSNVTDPSGNHKVLYMGDLLHSVLTKIQEDKSELDTFIEDVLEKMSPFTDALVAKLRKSMPTLKPQSFNIQ